MKDEMNLANVIVSAIIGGVITGTLGAIIGLIVSRLTKNTIDIKILLLIFSFFVILFLVLALIFGVQSPVYYVIQGTKTSQVTENPPIDSLKIKEVSRGTISIIYPNIGEVSTDNKIIPWRITGRGNSWNNIGTGRDGSEEFLIKVLINISIKGKPYLEIYTDRGYEQPLSAIEGNIYSFKVFLNHFGVHDFNLFDKVSDVDKKLIASWRFE